MTGSNLQEIIDISPGEPPVRHDYDWRDIGFTATGLVWHYLTYWRVVEQSGWDMTENGRLIAEVTYIKPGGGSNDWTADPDEAETFLDVYIKPDGCADFSVTNCMHLCGYGHVQQVQALMTRLFEMTAWHLGDQVSIPEDFPAPKHWPSQANTVQS